MGRYEIISPGRSFGELGKIAWAALKGRWGAAIGTSCIVLGIQMAAGMVPLFGRLAGLLLCPLTAGMMLFWLRLFRGEKTELSVAFEPFDRYWTFLWANLRVMIFIFLWILLLIVPGLVAAFRYAMTIYILLDHPEYSAEEAMKESCEIMYGHKLRLFGYSLLFTLMIVFAAVFTLGIGLIWLIPWLGVFMAAFYETVRKPDGSTEAEEPPAALPEPAEAEETSAALPEPDKTEETSAAE
ncbi:MAG: DUF975 family protein [Lentisphaeria bacterium]|nr:DUF975 family protein [Lentisphaeria bacterium]